MYIGTYMYILVHLYNICMYTWGCMYGYSVEIKSVQRQLCLPIGYRWQDAIDFVPWMPASAEASPFPESELCWTSQLPPPHESTTYFFSYLMLNVLCENLFRIVFISVNLLFSSLYFIVVKFKYVFINNTVQNGLLIL